MDGLGLSTCFSNRVKHHLIENASNTCDSPSVYGSVCCCQWSIISARWRAAILICLSICRTSIYTLLLNENDEWWYDDLFDPSTSIVLRWGLRWSGRLVSDRVVASIVSFPLVVWVAFDLFSCKGTLVTPWTRSDNWPSPHAAIDRTGVIVYHSFKQTYVRIINYFFSVSSRHRNDYTLQWWWYKGELQLIFLS